MCAHVTTNRLHVQGWIGEEMISRVAAAAVLNENRVHNIRVIRSSSLTRWRGRKFSTRAGEIIVVCVCVYIISETVCRLDY